VLWHAQVKPRKRRTQTLAEKGVGGTLHSWQALLDSYVFAPTPEVMATLIERDGVWVMTVSANGKRYVGERLTLEDAFKATANLLYKQAKDVWLRMESSAVTESWAHTLEGL
jgi:hypothetical protein